jgi:hypothetical protein
MKLIKTLFLLLTVSLVALVGNGCATASKKASGSGFTKDKVRFVSNVPCIVQVEGYNAETPCEFMLDSRPFFLIAEADHYLPVRTVIDKKWTTRGTVSLVGDIAACVIPPAGAGALALDAGTGSFTELPKVVRIELLPDPDDPPPAVQKAKKKSRVTTQ